MKNIILTIILTVLTACGQEKKHIMNTQYPEVNSNNFAQKLINSIKHFEKEPIYYIRINKINCLVEILINDYPVHDDYELSNYATPLEINDAILKSGEQKLTYRLYPVGDLIKEEYGEGDTVAKLTNNTSISISIIKMDNNSQKEIEDEEVIMKHTSLTDAKGNFLASGKPYYEFTFSFTANVPYEDEGWTKGQDLTKVDQKLLEQKAVEFYKDYSKMYDDKDSNLQAKLKFGEEKRNAIAFYKNHNDINSLWKKYTDRLYYKNKKNSLINNYKMIFFGNGRIVFLLSNTLKLPYRGGGALKIDYTDNDGNQAFFMPNICLYLPEGKKLEDGLYMIN